MKPDILDFSLPALSSTRLRHAGSGKHATSRFATILFYLNDDMEGGETLSSVVEYETPTLSKSNRKRQGHFVLQSFAGRKLR
jgi:hypothetical protein